MKKSYRFSAALLTVALLSACASDPKFIGRPDLTLVPDGQLPPPAGQDLILEQRAYVVGPFDRISVDVYGVPELQRTVQVDASGRASLPLIGELNVAGQTPGQLATLVEARLRGKYVRDPHAIVNVDSVNQKIAVNGQVKVPGLYPVTGRMTLMRAIAVAQGTTEFAAKDYVVVFRRVNGQQMAALYNIGAIRSGAYEDPEVFANDLIEVGDSSARRTFRDILSAAPLIVSPVVALIR
ncbi:polysaccharide biosynthesis/export family protein [Sphingomonas sp. MJ1 (PH-R8)]|uniref:polysaccharide biosynthesis/export family protein n=1 Tax=Sphingomonas sp. MJ1 (PH-R8) TaxID=3112950 RepID=UPI003A880452